MALPDTKETVQDGNLNFATGDSDNTFACIGPCSGGSTGVVYQFNAPDDVSATLGTGPAVESMAAILEAAGGTFLFSKPATSADSAPTVTQAAGSPPAVGTTGVPLDAYEGQVKITKAGTLGVSTFSYTLDNGDTWSPDIATAATYLIPNSGITLTFAAGTYVLADVYTFSSKGPQMSIAQFNTALDVLTADPRDWSILHQVGIPYDTTDTLKIAAAVAMAANIQTKLEAAFLAHLPARAIIDGPDVANDATADALYVSGVASTAAARVVLVADFGEIRSPISSRVYKRPAAWPVVARAMKAPISEDLAYVAEGKLMSSLTSIRRDEAARQALNTARITTLRTFRKKPGFYITKPKTLAAAGSDYELLQHGRIIDKACRIVRDVMLPRLNGKVRTNKDGTIHEIDARVIEQALETALKRDMVPDHVVSVLAVINRTDNILSTKKMRVKVSALPYAYPEQIEETLGFATLVAQAA